MSFIIIRLAAVILLYVSVGKCIRIENSGSVSMLARFLYHLKGIVLSPRMYLFHKKQQEDQTWCFELNGICMMLEGFFVRDNCHWLRNPQKVIAFFNIDQNIYGLSNITNTKYTAEEFYDVMYQQYAYFNREPVSEGVFREYGFILTGDSWGLDLTDNLGIPNKLEYHPESGWFYGNRKLKHQPSSIGDLMRLYMQKTGAALKKVS